MFIYKKLHLFMFMQFVLILLIFNKNGQTTVIAPKPIDQGCTGSVVLSSAYHKYAITVDAEKMRKKKRKVKPIKGRDPKNRKWLRFEIVTFSGSCDWTVHEKKMGGRNEKMAGAKTIRLDWSVRKVKLI